MFRFFTSIFYMEMYIYVLFRLFTTGRSHFFEGIFCNSGTNKWPLAFPKALTTLWLNTKKRALGLGKGFRILKTNASAHQNRHS